MFITQKAKEKREKEEAEAKAKVEKAAKEQEAAEAKAQKDEVYLMLGYVQGYAIFIICVILRLTRSPKK